MDNVQTCLGLQSIEFHWCPNNSRAFRAQEHFFNLKENKITLRSDTFFNILYPSKLYLYLRNSLRKSIPILPKSIYSFQGQGFKLIRKSDGRFCF